MHASSKISCLLVTGVLAAATPGNAAPRSCPRGQRPTPSGCASTTPSLRSTAPAAGAKAAPGNSDSPPRPNAPEVDFRPDPSLVRRHRDLLADEIAGLEMLLQKTPAKARDRAAIVLRLADDYAELTALAEREHTRREIELEAAQHELDRSERERTQKKSTDESRGTPSPPPGPPHRPIRM